MSGAAQVADTYTFAIPDDWHPLPASAPDTETAVEAIVAAIDVEGEPRERLRLALIAVSGFAQSEDRANRLHWAFVPDAASGRVEGLMSLRTFRSKPGDVSRYSTLIEESGKHRTDLVTRTQELIELPAGAAVSVHEFVVDAPAGGVPDPAVERAVVAVFPRDSDRAYEFAITTQNLAAFLDITEYATAVASTLGKTKDAE